tara:strand:- start:145 stop:549 length:405 start_codon:yes stop_codon:yes gene_type:complete
MGRVFFNTRKNVHTLTAAYTVLASDSGKVFMINSAGGAFNVTLPTSLEDGLMYKFISVDTTADVQILSTTDIIDIVGLDSETDAGFSSAGTAKGKIILEAAGHKSQYVNLYCDGTSWYGEGMASVDDGITVAAA